MSGILRRIPGLDGFRAGQQDAVSAKQAGLAQYGGLLSLQNNLTQMQEAQEYAPLRRVKMEAELRAINNPAPKWQVTERFNEATGKKEKVIVDLNNPSNVMPFGGQEARNLSFQNTGGSILGLDPTTGQPVGQPIPITLSPHQNWQQNVQFPQQQALTQRGQDVTLAGINRPVFNESVGGFITPPQVGVGGPRPAPIPQAGGSIPAVPSAFGLPQPAPRPASPAPVAGPQVTPVPGLTPGGGKAQSSDVERVSAGYADRMINSANILAELEKKGVGKPEILETVAGVGYGDLGKIASNVSMSKERQQYRQAQEDWVRAKLRKESGAVIADEEMDREIRVYFPQIGDSPEVVKQKALSRRTAEQAMVQSAGRAGVRSQYSGPERRLPAVDEVKDGYRFKGGNPADPASWEKQ